MKVNRLLALFLMIGIVFSSIFVFQRGSIENNYKNVEITLDYDEVLKMAAESGKSVSYFLKEFKDMNVSSVALNEMTLNSLSERENFKVKTSLDGYDLIVEADEGIFNFIVEGLSRKIDKNRIQIIGENSLRIEGNRKDYIYDETNTKDINGKTIGKRKIGEGLKLEFLGLGFLQEDIDLIKNAGLNVLPRPIYMAEYENENSINYYFDFLDKENIHPDFIIFAGGEVLGWDKNLDKLKKELEERNMVVGMIETQVQREHMEQKGLEDLVRNSGYQATRVFNIWNWIQIRYDYEMPMHRQGQEIMNSIYRAVTERNVRIVYFKPFIDSNDKYVTDMGIYKERFKELEDRLYNGHQLRLGKVNAMKDFHPNKWMQLPIAIGAIASLFILLDNLFKVSRNLIQIGFLLGAGGSIGIYAANIKIDLFNKLCALLGSITMPSLAMVFILFTVKEILKHKSKIKIGNILFRGILILLMGAVISFVGVLFEVSLLSDIKYLLEMDIFKGVKLSQIGPILCTILIYLSIFGYKRKEDKKGIDLKEIVNLFKEDIKVGHMIVVGIIAVAGIIFIARTGHETNIKPSTIELLSRNILELILPARPRTKAFLIAYPALMLMIYLAFKNRKWAILPLSLAVVLGQSDIVNTFSHLRAPLYLSFMRTNYEFLFGIPIGAVAVLIVHFIDLRLEGRKRNA